MLKKALSVMLSALLVVSFCSCSKTDETAQQDDINSEQTSSAEEIKEPENPNAVNYLTGVYDLDKSKTGKRPVAIMVDNDSSAQTYTQTGVADADIVYETETEGGITRLMAVFADVDKIIEIGDVRSARYAYVDLALAHNAIYVHSGKDMTYCQPHLKDIDNFEIGTNVYGVRKTYGKAFSWQTLFTDGKTLSKGFADKKWKTDTDKNQNWQDFADEKESITLSTPANKIVAAFNGASISNFSYDAESGKYIKTTPKVQNKNRVDGRPYAFKNVLILKTKMSMYPDNYRRKVDLVGGSGFYAVNGTYAPIKWKKGNSTSPITITNEDGSPVKYNAGNTWVCIINETSKITFE